MWSIKADMRINELQQQHYEIVWWGAGVVVGGDAKSFSYQI